MFMSKEFKWNLDEKQGQIKWNTQLVGSSFRFKISLPVYFANQWRRWVSNSIELVCFRGFFRVDSYIYYICDMSWKLIQKCYITI